MKRLALFPVLSILVVAACGGGSGTDSTSADESLSGTGCERAGGSCVALAPGACNGTVMSSSKYSCETGGRIGLECCMASASGSCSNSSDCTGALPRNEVRCKDGSFSGASWECLRLNGPGGFCSISYCEGHGGEGVSASPSGDSDGGPSGDTDSGSSGSVDSGSPEGEDGGAGSGDGG
jgi:hypothetical protein